MPILGTFSGHYYWLSNLCGNALPRPEFIGIIYQNFRRVLCLPWNFCPFGEVSRNNHLIRPSWFGSRGFSMIIIDSWFLREPVSLYLGLSTNPAGQLISRFPARIHSMPYFKAQVNFV